MKKAVNYFCYINKVDEPTLPSSVLLLTICMVEIWICGMQLRVYMCARKRE